MKQNIMQTEKRRRVESEITKKMRHEISLGEKLPPVLEHQLGINLVEQYHI